MKIYIDEAGRGPLAGPMYVGLLAPIKRFKKSLYKDSKSITEKQRNDLFWKITILKTENKCLYAIWIVDNQEIDKYWITSSLMLAICRGLKKLLKEYLSNKTDDINTICSCDTMDKITLDSLLNTNKLSIDDYKLLITKFEQFFWKLEIIIDGNKDFWLNKKLWISTKTMIKWDQKEPYISIASIIAKVSRDRRMVEKWDKKFPLYWFKQHKGYGTKFHQEMIKKYGASTIHRKLFLKKMQWNIQKNIFKKLTQIMDI